MGNGQPRMGEQTAANRSVDVTGLSEEAIHVVQSLVSVLRSKPSNPRPIFASHQEWAKALWEWSESHPNRDNPADDSREAIYGDDREE